MTCALGLAAACSAQAGEGTGGTLAQAGGVISLEDAYSRTLATDQSIRIAYWEIRKANLLTWSALARIGPQLNGGGTYNRNQSRSPGSVIVSEPTTTSQGQSQIETLTSTSETSNVNLTYTQPILDFSVFPAFKYGKLAAIAARLQHQYTIRQTLFGVTSAYYQVLTQEGIVAVDLKTVELSSEQFDVAQKRLNVGEVTRADALNARVTYESARRALIEARNTLLLNRDTLGNILNLGGDNGFEVVTPPDYPTTIPPFEKLLAIAYRNREDLRVADIAIGEDEQKKGEVWAEYAPQVAGSLSDSYANARGLYGPQSQVWDASISVSMPFFTGGQREIDLKTAGEQIEEDQLNREKAAKTVEGDVRQAWLNANSLSESLPALRLQVDAARQSYQDLQHQYEAGTAASVDVLVALTTLNTSENELATQVFALQVALRNLEETAGVFQQRRVQQAKIK